MTQPKSRKAEFNEEITAALENSPYRDIDRNLHQIYCIGLLKELLIYSAIDLFEVRKHIEYLAERPRPDIAKPKLK